MRRRVWYAVAAAILVAVAVVAFVSYRGTGPSGTPSQQLAHWVADTTLGQHLGELHDDNLDLDEALSHHSGTGAVHTVCSVMIVTAEAANADLPSPDTEVTQLLAQAYSLEDDAGANCYAAGATNDKLLAKSAAERAQAQLVVTRVLARVAAVTGRTLSTTTTTQPTAGTGIFG